MYDLCPFCGSSTVGLFAGRQAKFVVTCLGPGCGATGPEGDTPTQARERWQTRVAGQATHPVAEGQPEPWSGGTTGRLPTTMDAPAEKQALIQHSLETFRAMLGRENYGT